MLPSQLANVQPDKFCSTKITIMDYLWPNGEMILQIYSEDRENISLQQLKYDYFIWIMLRGHLPFCLEATKCLYGKENML